MPGHQFLYEQGILHCYVSSCTVFLSASTNPREGSEGFITDAEFATSSREAVMIVGNHLSLPKPLIERFLGNSTIHGHGDPEGNEKR